MIFILREGRPLPPSPLRVLEDWKENLRSIDRGGDSKSPGREEKNVGIVNINRGLIDLRERLQKYSDFG